MTGKWLTGVVAVILAIGSWMLVATSRTEGVSTHKEATQDAPYEYKIITPIAFAREKTPLGETRGVVTFNELGAEGWEYAGSFGGDASNMVFKRRKRK